MRAIFPIARVSCLLSSRLPRSKPSPSACQRPSDPSASHCPSCANPLPAVRPDTCLSPWAIAQSTPTATSVPVSSVPPQQQLQYQVLGNDMQVLEILPQPGQSGIDEAGAMNYMKASITLATRFGDLGRFMKE